MSKKGFVILAFTVALVHAGVVPGKACSYDFCPWWPVVYPQRLGFGTGFPGFFNGYAGYPFAPGQGYEAAGFHAPRHDPPPSPTIVIIHCRDRSEQVSVAAREEATATPVKSERVNAWRADKDGPAARVPLIIEEPQPRRSNGPTVVVIGPPAPSKPPD